MLNNPKEDDTWTVYEILMDQPVSSNLYIELLANHRRAFVSLKGWTTMQLIIRDVKLRRNQQVTFININYYFLDCCDIV